jgi:reactive intermediate/imine deaminase
MSEKQVIQSDQAPKAIGPYSQAIKVGSTVYFSGQIPLHPKTMALVEGDFSAQVRQVFVNLQEVAQAAGGGLKDIVKLTIYLTDLSHFSVFNDVMMAFFTPPYPARTTIQVSALPKAAQVEVEAIMVL